MEDIGAAAAQSNGLNWVDIIVIFMMLASGAFAAMRGFVKEAFMLVSLVAATVVATKLFPIVQPWMREQIESRVAADVCAGLGVFVLALIAFIPITSFFVDRVKGTAMTSIDRALGFVFGALRGLLIAVLLFLLASQFWDKPEEAPYWIKEARSKSLLEEGANLVKDLVPLKKNADEELDPELAAQDGTEAAKGEQIDKAQRLLQRLSKPEPELNPQQPAYDEGARQRLDQLIQQKSQ
jgi:membrane protein required for colicin V production